MRGVYECVLRGDLGDIRLRMKAMLQVRDQPRKCVAARLVVEQDTYPLMCDLEAEWLADVQVDGIRLPFAG